jgi:hypothetical protein
MKTDSLHDEAVRIGNSGASSHANAIDYRHGSRYLFSHRASVSTWLVVSKIPTSEKTGLHRMEASDSQALLALIADLRKKVAAKLGVETAVVSCFEAGRDGFWLHRLLSEHGVINHVAEPKRTPNASIVSENISSRKGFASRTGLTLC